MDPDLRQTLNQLGTATISMQLLKRGLRQVSMAGVRALGDPVRRVVGPAYTLRFIPMREDLSAPEVLGARDYPPRVAIEEAPPGSVLVIDGRGRGDIAVVGDILVERLKVRGVAGLVTDGGVRDAAGVAAVDFPVYAAGPAAPAHIAGHAAGDVQCSIACGGIAVIPGDVVVADGDGVVVIPQALMAEVARDGLEQERFERFIKIKLAEGRPVPGLYPPDEGTKSEYAAWIEAGEPEG